MNLVPYETIAMSAGVSLRTVTRDVKRRLLIPYKRGRKALIDADAPPRPITSPDAGLPTGGASAGDARVSGSWASDRHG
jgi:hypothetical protein